jgi:dUTP pyrophosphatase
MGIIKIKRVDKSLPLPAVATKGSIGMDLYAREDVTILPGHTKLVPLNTILVDYPDGYAPFVFPRSSLFAKKGLMQGNSVGVIDLDYRGEHDELMIILHNVLGIPAIIKKGERIAQVVFMAVINPGNCTIEETAVAADKSRLGHGSTGGYAG